VHQTIDIVTNFKQMKIGLYFGSFNPVHIGHMAIANYILEFSEIDKLWFVVSPQNPMKNKASLLAENHRYELLNLAITDVSKYKVCTVEFNMPKPSYTIDTLTYLTEKYPENKFYLIMGADNLASFKKWKNYDVILKNYKILVYPRPGFDDLKLLSHKNIIKVNAPLIEISSSFIRKAIKQKIDVRTMPFVDVNKLKNEDIVNDSKDQPWRFGKNIPVDLGLKNSGTWDFLPNGDKLWRLMIYSPGALTITAFIVFFIVVSTYLVPVLVSR